MTALIDPSRHAQLRKLWRANCALFKRVAQENEARDARFVLAAKAGYSHPAEPHLPLPVLPTELRGLPCGAKTRAGQPCKRTDIFDNGRCKFHGGASTGPRSADGIARARANLALRHAPRPSEAHARTGNDAASLKIEQIASEPVEALRKVDVPLGAVPAVATTGMAHEKLAAIIRETLARQRAAR